MNDAEKIEWQHHARLYYYEMEDSLSLERLYQAFRARMLREQAEAAEQFAQEQKDAFEVLRNGGEK